MCGTSKTGGRWGGTWNDHATGCIAVKLTLHFPFSFSFKIFFSFFLLFINKTIINTMSDNERGGSTGDDELSLPKG